MPIFKILMLVLLSTFISTCYDYDNFIECYDCYSALDGYCGTMQGTSLHLCDEDEVCSITLSVSIKSKDLYVGRHCVYNCTAYRWVWIMDDEEEMKDCKTCNTDGCNGVVINGPKIPKISGTRPLFQSFQTFSVLLFTFVVKIFI